jgi:hypothetical protein
LFEKLGFPDWPHHYPSFGNIENSPLAFIKNPDQEIFQDFSDLDEAEKNMQIINRLKELVTEEQRKSEDPYYRMQDVIRFKRKDIDKWVEACKRNGVDIKNLKVREIEDDYLL